MVPVPSLAVLKPEPGLAVLGIGIPPMDEPMGGPSCGPPLEGVEGLVMVVPRFGSVRVPKPSPLFFLKIGIEKERKSCGNVQNVVATLYSSYCLK